MAMPAARAIRGCAALRYARAGAHSLPRTLNHSYPYRGGIIIFYLHTCVTHPNHLHIRTPAYLHINPPIRRLGYFYRLLAPLFSSR